MAFLQKTWKDRVAEYINRRVLTKEDGTTELVSVERSEGTISQEGDAFSAANMNDLEQRIANEFSEQNKKFAWKTYGRKLLTSGGGTVNTIDLSDLSEYNEVKFLIPTDNSYMFYVEVVVPIEMMKSATEKHFRSGFYYTSSDNNLSQVIVKDMVTEAQTYKQGSSVGNLEVTILYR